VKKRCNKQFHILRIIYNIKKTRRIEEDTTFHKRAFEISTLLYEENALEQAHAEASRTPSPHEATEIMSVTQAAQLDVEAPEPQRLNGVV